MSDIFPDKLSTGRRTDDPEMLTIGEKMQKE